MEHADADGEDMPITECERLYGGLNTKLVESTVVLKDAKSASRCEGCVKDDAWGWTH